MAALAFGFLPTGAAAQSLDACTRPAALQDAAFDQPMEFAAATNKGNMSTSAWIAAVGEIGPDTPQKFKSFMESEGAGRVQIVTCPPRVPRS